MGLNTVYFSVVLTPGKKRPTGGNGGRGGDVYVVADRGLNGMSFTTFHFNAGHGKNGGSKMMLWGFVDVQQSASLDFLFRFTVILGFSQMSISFLSDSLRCLLSSQRNFNFPTLFVTLSHILQHHTLSSRNILSEITVR